MAPPAHVVLRGPRTPHWACACGQSDNFASRLECRTCPRPAPRGVASRAHARAKLAEAKERRVTDAPGCPTERKPAAARSAAPAELRKLQDKAARLEAELAALRNPRAADGTAGSADGHAGGEGGPAKASLASLVRQRAAYVREVISTPEDPILAQFDLQIQRAKDETWAAKEPDQQVRALETILRKATAQHGKQVAALAKLREDLQDAETAERDGRKKMEEADQNLALARSRLPTVSPPGTCPWVDRAFAEIPADVRKGHEGILAKCRNMLSSIGAPAAAADVPDDVMGGGAAHGDASVPRATPKVSGTVMPDDPASLPPDFVQRLGGMDVAKRFIEAVAVEQGGINGLLKRMRTKPPEHEAAPADASGTSLP